MPVRLLACARVFTAIAALFLLTGIARADKRRAALVNANDVLARQVAIALATWDLEVRQVPWASLGGEMPEAAAEARKVADAFDVEAVIWISNVRSRPALWIYDVEAGHAVTRPLPSAGVPSDVADAASLALTVKTLMRTTNAAPPSERIGAGAERPVGPLGVLRAEADAGGRLFATKSGSPDARFAITALWFPKFLDQYAGLALGVAAGPGVGVETPDFTGRLFDVAFAPALRFAFPIGRFALEPSIGPVIHLTRIDGASPQSATHAGASRVDPSLDGSLLFSYALTRGVSVGLRGGLSYLLQYQRYLIQGQPVLEVSPLHVSASAVIGARFL
jgi:hypothetical protein